MVLVEKNILALDLLMFPSHDMLLQCSDKQSIVYVEHCKIFVKNDSVWKQDSVCAESLQIAFISVILLGPGTSITHDAATLLGSFNVLISWCGENGFSMYSVSMSPVYNMKNARKQIHLIETDKINIARKIYEKRFGKTYNLENMTINNMMLMEGNILKSIYKEMAKKYSIFWNGRHAQFKNIECDDIVNKTLTLCNGALYSVVNSIIYSLGFIPQIGVIHTSGSTPLAYDIADIYKTATTIECSFKYASENNTVDKKKIFDFLKNTFEKENIMQKISSDILDIFSL
jgi:CRISPR-associated protein Cas1